MGTKNVIKLPKLPLVKGTSSFEIFIPKEVESKIRHLCSVVHDVEWSGTLFYTYSGSLDDGTFKVTCVDLFVMDIGSSAYTEFKESADVINYRVEHDLLREDIMEGLIHSHNNMATFFSGTDCATLAEEGTNTNHFVSLIVNNAGVYTAAVTRRVITESKIEAHIKSTDSTYYHTYNDEIVIIEDDKVKEEDKSTVTKREVIEYYDLRVTKEDVYLFNDIDSRLKELRKGKYSSYTASYKGASSSAPKNTTQPNKGTTGYGGYGGYTGYPYDMYDDWDDVDDFNNYPRSSYPSTVIEPNKSVFQTQKKEEQKEQEEAPSEETVEEIPLCLQESFDDALIKHLSLQLLTGSIIISESGVNPTEWVRKMDAVYEKRFGILDYDEHPLGDTTEMVNNNARLENWVESMVEFLVYTRDEDLLSRLNAIGKDYNTTYDESDTAEVCAFCMYQYLDSLPASYVKDAMLTALNTYIPNGAKDYIRN